MIDDFRVELAKLLSILAVVLVAVMGLITRLSIEVIFLRAAIGGIAFAAIGFLAGHVIEQQRPESVPPEETPVETEVIQTTQLLEKTYGATNPNTQKTQNTQGLQQRETAAKNETNEDNGVEEFSPLDIQNLSKIIVDSLNE